MQALHVYCRCRNCPTFYVHSAISVNSRKLGMAEEVRRAVWNILKHSPNQRWARKGRKVAFFTHRTWGLFHIPHYTLANNTNRWCSVGSSTNCRQRQSATSSWVCRFTIVMAYVNFDLLTFKEK
jgi:hypothetical protein